MIDPKSAASRHGANHRSGKPDRIDQPRQAKAGIWCGIALIVLYAATNSN